MWGHTIERMRDSLTLRLRSLASLLHRGSLGASLPLPYNCTRIVK